MCGGIGVLVFALIYAMGYGHTSAQLVALVAAAGLGAFAPDLGLPGAPITYLFGRRGAYTSLWAGRLGHDGGPMHSLIAVVTTAGLVGLPPTVVFGFDVAVTPVAAFATAYLIHLALDGLSGRHPLRLLWPITERAHERLGEGIGKGVGTSRRAAGKAGRNALKSTDAKIRGWLQPPAKRPKRTPSEKRRRSNRGTGGRNKSSKGQASKERRATARGRGRGAEETPQHRQPPGAGQTELSEGCEEALSSTERDPVAAQGTNNEEDRRGVANPREPRREE